eukprot:gene12374-2257_t
MCECEAGYVWIIPALFMRLWFASPPKFRLGSSTLHSLGRPTRDSRSALNASEVAAPVASGRFAKRSRAEASGRPACTHAMAWVVAAAYCPGLATTLMWKQVLSSAGKSVELLEPLSAVAAHNRCPALTTAAVPPCPWYLWAASITIQLPSLTPALAHGVLGFIFAEIMERCLVPLQAVCEAVLVEYLCSSVIAAEASPERDQLIKSCAPALSPAAVLRLLCENGTGYCTLDGVAVATSAVLHVVKHPGPSLVPYYAALDDLALTLVSLSRNATSTDSSKRQLASRAIPAALFLAQTLTKHGGMHTYESLSSSLWGHLLAFAHPAMAASESQCPLPLPASCQLLASVLAIVLASQALLCCNALVDLGTGVGTVCLSSIAAAGKQLLATRPGSKSPSVECAFALLQLVLAHTPVQAAFTELGVTAVNPQCSKRTLELLTPNEVPWHLPPVVRLNDRKEVLGLTASMISHMLCRQIVPPQHMVLIALQCTLALFPTQDYLLCCALCPFVPTKLKDEVLGHLFEGVSRQVSSTMDGQNDNLHPQAEQQFPSAFGITS